MISEPNSVNALHNPVSRTVHIRSGGERKKKEKEKPRQAYMLRTEQLKQSLSWDHPVIDPQPVHILTILTLVSLSRDL